MGMLITPATDGPQRRPANVTPPINEGTKINLRPRTRLIEFFLTPTQRLHAYGLLVSCPANNVPFV